MLVGPFKNLLVRPILEHHGLELFCRWRRALVWRQSHVGLQEEALRLIVTIVVACFVGFGKKLIERLDLDLRKVDA